MEFKTAILVMILIMALFTSIAPAISSDHSMDISASDHSPGTTKREAVGISSGSYCGRSQIANQDKFGHGGGHPATFAGSSAHGNEPHSQGGSTSSMIPLYAAGMAAGANSHHGNNNRKRNSGMHSYSCHGLVTLAVTVLVRVQLREY